MRFPSIIGWSPERVQQLLDAAPGVHLDGVEIYVVGAGATSAGDLTPGQIAGIDRFWTAFLERSGGHLAFFGSSLAAYPIARDA
jgi:hypothetical protein